MADANRKGPREARVYTDEAVDRTRLPPVNTSVDGGVDVAQRRVPWRGTVLALGGVIACWVGAVSIGTLLHPAGQVHTIGLFVHLMSLVVGFGAVIVLDVYGASALLGLRGRRAASAPRHRVRVIRRGPVEVARFAASLNPIIWTGLAGLVVSGAVLSPNVDSPVTWLKLLAVLAVAVNGVNAHHLCSKLTSLPTSLTLKDLPTQLKIRLLGTGAVSQAAWWTAFVVGYWANIQ
jgi:hypothetical protein